MDKEIETETIELFGKKIKVELAANSIIVNRNAFYRSWWTGSGVELDSVFTSDGKRSYNLNYPYAGQPKIVKYYFSIEKNLNKLYGNKYCLKHSRLIGLKEIGKCDLCD